MKTIMDESLAQRIEICGSCMRFFLNAAAAIGTMISLLLLTFVRPLNLKILIVVSMPLAISLLLFIIFLRLLKQVENLAAGRGDIGLVSRVIWELNKSFLIRAAIGRTPTFMKDQ
jgi:hypothetical protein